MCGRFASYKHHEKLNKIFDLKNNQVIAEFQSLTTISISKSRQEAGQLRTWAHPQARQPPQSTAVNNHQPEKRP